MKKHILSRQNFSYEYYSYVSQLKEFYVVTWYFIVVTFV